MVLKIKKESNQPHRNPEDFPKSRGQLGRLVGHAKRQESGREDAESRRVPGNTARPHSSGSPGLNSPTLFRLKLQRYSPSSSVGTDQ